MRREPLLDSVWSALIAAMLLVSPEQKVATIAIAAALLAVTLFLLARGFPGGERRHHDL